MPKFFVDIVANSVSHHDEKGGRYKNEDHARSDARQALIQMMSIGLQADGDQHCSATIRDASGALVESIALTMVISPPGGGSLGPSEVSLT